MSLFLVTGGAGFIGSHITEELLRGGHHVRVLDNFVTGKRENLIFPKLQGHGELLEIMEGDIRSTEDVKKAVGGVEYLIHQAALPSVQRSIDDPISSNAVNVTGSLNLLVAARDQKVKRFVYASSSSIYGNTLVLPKSEDMAPNPISPYAISKLAAEKYTVAFGTIYGLPIVCLRYFNVFGPRQDPTSLYSAVIPLFITSLLQGRAPVINGDGLNSRDFTYVKNVVRANLLACECPSAVGNVFNIACGRRYSLLDLCNHLKELLNSSIEVDFQQERPGDVKHSQASIELAKRLLGYSPVEDFREGLKHTINWYRETQKTTRD